MRLLLVTLLLLLAPCAWGESGVDTLDAFAFESEESFALDLEEGDAPVATGPGFRWFARATVGGFYVSEGFEHKPQPVVSQGLVHVRSDILDSPAPNDIDGGSDTLTIAAFDSRGNPIVALYDTADLHRFSTGYDSFRKADIRSLTSIEVLGQHIWDNNEGLVNSLMAPRLRIEAGGAGFDVGSCPVAERAPLIKNADETNERWWQGFLHANYLAYGIRYNRGADRSDFDASSDLFGPLYSYTDVVMNLIGPQIAVGRTISKRRWMFDLSGSLLVGYARADFKQSNGIGETTPSGGATNLLFMEPTYSHHQRREEGVGALAELRLVNSYLFHKNWTLDLIGRAFVTGPWHHANQVVQYDLPDFGLAEGESGYLAGANLMLGVTHLR